MTMNAQVRAVPYDDQPEVGYRCGQPLAEDGREIVSVRMLLEWAFAAECASLDFDELDEGYGAGFGAEYRIMQQLALGKRRGEGVRVDTSFGTSHPHHDAEIVSSVLCSSVAPSLAIQMAQLARARTMPRWDLGPSRIQPRAWGKPNQYGAQAKVEVHRRIRYVSRGRARDREVLWCPVEVVPTVRAVHAARRGYLDWWGGLLSLLAVLRQADLDLFVVSDAMPPMEPWKQKA